jgi:hypothetical protein
MHISFFGNEYNTILYDYQKNINILRDSVDGNILYERYINNINCCIRMPNGCVFSSEKLLYIINIKQKNIKSIDYYFTKLKVGDTIHRIHALDNIISIFLFDILKFEYKNNLIIESIIKCDEFIFTDYLKSVVNNDNHFNFLILTKKNIHYIFSAVCILLQVIVKRNIECDSMAMAMSNDIKC